MTPQLPVPQLPVLVEVVRSGYVECTHTGSVLVLRPDGSTALALGDVTTPIFPRSSNKPLQAVAMLELGWQPDPEELAVATASHSGQEQHVHVVRRILSGAGLAESALGCVTALPLHEATAHAVLAGGGRAEALTMNCSGKHAGMLATCVINGWTTEGYLARDHPLQVAILASIERQAGEPVRHVAVDGCGAPQHALSLTGLARAFGALGGAGGAGGALRRTADAMRAHPFLVGGDDRDVTELMQHVPGLVAKDGAEGVYAAGLADGSAVVVKIADGAGRGRTPVLVAGLRALGVAGLDRWATSAVLGGGVRVGETRVSAALA